jgi:hypothetical protein
MNRRELIALLGSTAVSWPGAVGAQQAAIPVVGFLHSGSPETLQHLLSGFHQGLAETGFVEGQNVKIEYRWARGQYNQVPALAAELVDHRVSVIVAGGGEVTALAVKAATQTIPVVFTTANDPVKLGLVQSLGHPGGNLTGSLAFTSSGRSSSRVPRPLVREQPTPAPPARTALSSRHREEADERRGLLSMRTAPSGGRRRTNPGLLRARAVD